jgi:hypothetical protein
MGAAGSPIASTLSEQAAADNGPFAAPSVAPLPAGGGLSLFLAIVTSLSALIALIALARLTVGEELFSSLHRKEDPSSSVRWPR